MPVEPRTMKHTLNLKSGVFVISIDFELIWGTLDKPKWKDFQSLCGMEREVVIDRLLQLLERYEIPATWCTVGHLFLDRCESRNGHKHPEIARVPGSVDAVRFDRDPCSSEITDGIFYGRSLVRKIAACRVKQEIGSHSFSHTLFDERTCTRATAESDLVAAVEAARELGVELRSFVFPRNRVGHLDLLKKHGFVAYRGQDPAWHHRSKNRNPIHRLGHLADILFAVEPPVVMPRLDVSGVCEIPGSMLYTPSYGIRGKIPVSYRVNRARKGLLKAARTRKIFHLWFHPTDLVVRMDEMFEGLRQILEIASGLRAKGELRVLPMSEVAMEAASDAVHVGPEELVANHS